MSIAQHNVRLIFWGTLLSSVNFLEPVMALFYLQRGLTPTQIFFTLTAYAIPGLLAEVPTGAFADRFGPKASFVVGGTLNVISLLLLMLVKDPWSIFVSNAIWAVGYTFFSGAQEALIYESLKESGEADQMGAVSGKIQAARYIPLVISYLVGPILARGLQEWQFTMLIGLTALFLTGRLVLMCFIRIPRQYEEHRENPWVHVRNAVGTIRANPDLFKLFMHGSLVFIPTYVFARFDPPYLTGAGLPTAYLGVMWAAGALLSWAISHHVGFFTNRFPRVRLVRVCGGLILGALMAASLFQDSLFAASLAFFLVRFGQTLRSPVIGHMQQEYIPSGSRSTTLSVMQMLDGLLDALVVPLMSLLAVFGLPAIFAACAGVALLGLLFPVREAASARRQPAATL